jgi:hypothetical protein
LSFPFDAIRHYSKIEGTTAMKVRCPHCQSNLKVADQIRGRTGPCPKCGGAVLLEPYDPQAEVVPFADAAPAPGPSSSAASAAAAPGELSALPALARAGTIEPPKKTARAKLREIQEIKQEGARFLLRIRVLLVSLGLLMLGYNIYQYVSIDDMVAAFRVAVTTTPNARVDLSKLDQLCRTLGVALRVECVMYMTLGAALCALAIPIHKAPVICTWTALVIYCATWILDLSIVEMVFGEIAVGQMIFSLGTPIKAVIISGLWFGVRVGQAYQDQVIRPMREIVRAELEATPQ